TDDNRDRRTVEMEEGVDQLRPRLDRADVAFGEDRHVEQFEISRQELLAVAPPRREAVPALQARALKHMKGARKPMLVNRSGSVDPKEYVDVEPFAPEDGDRRLSELRFDIGLG